MFDIVMLYDNGESKYTAEFLASNKGACISNLAGMGVTMCIEKHGLKIGDFLWVARHKENKEMIVLDYIAERKSMPDLLSSILGKSDKVGTKRFLEQKRRMIASGISNRFYIVEGRYDDLNQVVLTQKMTQAEKTKIVKTAKIHAQLDGFELLETKDGQDSSKHLISITRRICLFFGRKNVDEWMHDAGAKKIPFEVFQNRMKIEAKSVGDVASQMMYQLPRVGPKTLEPILEAHPTMHSLISALG